MRCIARRSDRQDEACGGAMTLEFYRLPGAAVTEAPTVALADGLASFAARMSGAADLRDASSLRRREAQRR